ncbi:MAG: tetratricopeptide repeat protein [Pirellulales bacterium]|nr:tetratricopeptide repeat protein [Pirellulales bacterium]
MRRLNVKLLVYLIVALVAVGAVIAVLWRVNLSRTLEAQLADAQKAEAEGRREDAYEYYRRYLKQVPNSPQAACSLALVAADLADSTPTREMKAVAYNALEYALRLDASRTDVRERLVKYTMMIGRFSDAIDHLTILLTPYCEYPVDDNKVMTAQLTQDVTEAAEDKKAEMLEKVARYENDWATALFATGNDAEADQVFRFSIEHAPKQFETYLAYSTLLREKMRRPEDADAIISKLVEQNPDSFKAWLAKAQYDDRLGRFEDALKDVQKALELAPDEADSLLLHGRLLRQSGEFDAAEKDLLHCLELHPGDVRVYQQLASLYQQHDQPARAMEYVDAGIKRIPNSIELLMLKTDFQINDLDKEGAQKTMEKLRKLRPVAEQLDYLNARLLMLDGDHIKASQILESIRPLLTRNKDLRVHVNFLLARCYDRLGQRDLMADAYQRVLDDDPKNTAAELALRYEKLRLSNDPSELDPAEMAARGVALTEPTLFQIELSKQLGLPEAEQSWEGCQAIVDNFRKRVEALPDGEDKDRQSVLVRMLNAELLSYQGKVNEAMEIVRGEIARDPKEASFWLALSAHADRADPENGMLKILDEAEAAIGQNVLLLQMRLNRVARSRDEQAVKNLLALEPKVLEFKDPQDLTVLLGSMAELLFAMGNYPDAQRIFGIADEKAPTPDLRIRLRRFDLAYAARNEEDMLKLMESIANLMGKESAEYYYASASRIVSMIDAGKMDSTNVPEAREYVKKAHDLRPRWGALARLDAQLDEIEGNIESAVANYEKGIELGEVTRGYVIRLMTLYYTRGEYEKASQLMDSLRLNDRDDALGQFAARIAYAKGDLETALKLQQGTCEHSKSAEDFLFLGQLYEQHNKEGDIAAAEVAYRKAAELAQQSPRVWTTLVGFLIRNNRVKDAEDVVAELPQRLEEVRVHLVLAACWEMLGKADDAESEYTKQLNQDPQSFAAERNLAAFLIRANKRAEAVDHLNAILARQDQAKVSDQPHLVFARQTLAKLLSATGNYQELKRGLELIDQNARGGVLPVDDVMLKATLLGTRVDRTSRLQAIQLLEDLLRSRPGGVGSATPGEHFLLATLYDKEDSEEAWAKARDHMVSALTDNQENLLYLQTFIKMLIKRNVLNEAEAWMKKLEAVAPKTDFLVDCQARFLAASNKPEEALALIKDAVPDPIPALPEEINRVLGASRLLEELKIADYQPAEQQLMRYLTQRPEDVLFLAAFYGRRHNIDKAMEVCERAMANRTALEVSQTALLALRQCLDVAKPEHYEKAEVWVQKALADVPNDVRCELMQADLRDLQGNYAEAARLYEEILKRDDLGEGTRITAQNNLAYIKAVKFNDTKEALALINKALEIGGPMAELLDTKAIVLMGLGDVEQALRLLTESLMDTPTDPVKLFHLARAYVKASDLEMAQEKLELARKNGLDLKMLPQLEHDTYRDLLSSLGAGSGNTQ